MFLSLFWFVVLGFLGDFGCFSGLFLSGLDWGGGGFWCFEIFIGFFGSVLVFSIFFCALRVFVFLVNLS